MFRVRTVSPTAPSGTVATDGGEGRSALGLVSESSEQPASTNNDAMAMNVSLMKPLLRWMVSARCSLSGTRWHRPVMPPSSQSPDTLWRPSMHPSLVLLSLLGPVSPATASADPRPAPCGIAITGATLIDGNGGAPIADATVLVVDRKVEAAGPRAQVKVPDCAQIIDGRGKFLTPGFIDTNVHISLGGSMESNVR